MPPDTQELSPQDVQDLQDIAGRLPDGHPMRAKISTALQAQAPTAATLALVPNPQEQARQQIKQPVLQSGEFPKIAIEKPPLERLITGARARASAAQDENLAETARTGHAAGALSGPRLRNLGYNVAADTGELVKSAASPTSLGIGAAAAAVPEIVLPALAGYGGYEALKHGARAVRSATANEPGGIPYMVNPEETGAALANASMAAGATAGYLGGGRAALRQRGIQEPTNIQIARESLKQTGQAAVDIAKPAPAAIRSIARSAGIAAPAEPHEALMKALQPGANIPRAEESFKIAGPRLQQVRAATGAEISGPADLIPGAPVMQAAKKAVLDGIEQRLGPIAELQIDTSPIADAMEESISGRLERQDPKAAAAIRARAGTYRGNLSISDIEESIQQANKELAPMYQRAAGSPGVANAETQATEAEVRALRELQDKAVRNLNGTPDARTGINYTDEGIRKEFNIGNDKSLHDLVRDGSLTKNGDGSYSPTDKLGPNDSDIRNLKREYGALRDVERSAARANLVAARQKPGTLYEGLAALRAAGELLSGNPLSALKAGGTLAMGRHLKTIRSPEYLVDRAFNGPTAFGAAPEITGPPARAPRLALPPAPAEPILTPPPADTSGGMRRGPEHEVQPLAENRQLPAAPTPLPRRSQLPEAPTAEAPRARVVGGRLVTTNEAARPIITPAPERRILVTPEGTPVPRSAALARTRPEQTGPEEPGSIERGQAAAAALLRKLKIKKP